MYFYETLKNSETKMLFKEPYSQIKNLSLLTVKNGKISVIAEETLLNITEHLK